MQLSNSVLKCTATTQHRPFLVSFLARAHVLGLRMRACCEQPGVRRTAECLRTFHRRPKAVKRSKFFHRRLAGGETHKANAVSSPRSVFTVLHCEPGGGSAMLSRAVTPPRPTIVHSKQLPALGYSKLSSFGDLRVPLPFDLGRSGRLDSSASTTTH